MKKAKVNTYPVKPGVNSIELPSDYEILGARCEMQSTGQTMVFQGQEREVGREVVLIEVLEMVDPGEKVKVTVLATEESDELNQREDGYYRHIDRVFIRSAGLLFHIWEIIPEEFANDLEF